MICDNKSPIYMIFHHSSSSTWSRLFLMIFLVTYWVIQHG